MTTLLEIFKIAGVDATKGKAKSLMEAQKLSLAQRNDPTQFANAVKVTTPPPTGRVFIVTDRTVQAGEQAFNDEFFDRMSQVSELAADAINDNPELFAWDAELDLSQYPAGRIYLVTFDQLIQIAARKLGQ